LNDYYAKAA
jgi:hypothetical protein